MEDARQEAEQLCLVPVNSEIEAGSVQPLSSHPFPRLALAITTNESVYKCCGPTPGPVAWRDEVLRIYVDQRPAVHTC